MHLLVLAAIVATQQPLKPLITVDDYPSVAIENGWQGEVVADVSIDENGKATGCAIVRSSGYAILDSTTCKILTKRAKYRPKTDAAGRPVPYVYRTVPPISWRLN